MRAREEVSAATAMKPELPRAISEEERYVRGMERLLEAVHALSLARHLEDIQRIVCMVARDLIDCDGSMIALRDGAYCYYAEEDAVEPMWKGRRVERQGSISGWVMENLRPAVVTNITADPRSGQEADDPAFVRSLVMVPIGKHEPLGTIGVCWASRREPTDNELRLLQALADSTFMAMENVQIYAEMEARVRERTQALARAKQEIEALSVTDDMTGLLNRRGFYKAAEAALASRRPCVLAFVDVDGLKEVNDELGHAAGDALLIDLAETLRRCFRKRDVVARMGGDEFCVLIVDPDAGLDDLQRTFQVRINEFNRNSSAPYRLSASLGLVESQAAEPRSLEQLIVQADELMYAAKKAKKGR